ncbi:MAG: PfkB family carbohydrate kinase [Acidobacteria bacterium]|nr:PfkB family carbohydrate kinase [Acidobacteriota bacterium]
MKGRLEVVGLGLAIVDVVLRVERMPDWEDPRGLLDFALGDGGPAGTACFVASTFGLRTGFVDTVGDDELGEHRRRSLERAGVDTSRLVPREGPEDHVVVVYVDAATGERVFSFRRGFLSRPLSVSELDRGYVESARILHLDGSHAAAALAAARWMKESGGTVVLDAAATSHKVLEPARALVAETDVLICGSGFAPMLTGEEDVWRAGRAALDLGPRVVVQTEGARGSYSVARTGTRDVEFHTPAFEVDVVDTTGAGDTFHGAYLVGLARGWDLERCASFSSAVAALHCTVLGNRKGIPSMAEVEALMAARPAEKKTAAASTS